MYKVPNRIWVKIEETLDKREESANSFNPFLKRSFATGLAAILVFVISFGAMEKVRQNQVNDYLSDTLFNDEDVLDDVSDSLLEDL